MAYTADMSALLDLAKAFGPESQQAALDITEAAVTAGAQVARKTLGSCLQRRWKNSKTRFSQLITVSKTFVSGTAIYALVVFRHEFAQVIAGGKDVPPHPMPARVGKPPYEMWVGKGGKPKKWKTKGKSGQPGPVYISGSMTHPGYKGKDCLTPAGKQGGKTLRGALIKATLSLTRRLTRRGQ